MVAAESKRNSNVSWKQQELTRTDTMPNGIFSRLMILPWKGINNPGPYALQPTFYDVNVGSNDRNTESMLYADHTQSSTYYNESDPVGFGSGWAPDNFAAWMQTRNYTAIKSSKTTAWLGADIVSPYRERSITAFGTSLGSYVSYLGSY